MNKLLSLLRHYLTDNEIILMGFTLVVEAMALIKSHQADLLNSSADAVAHINLARMTFDSITPGFSQIGVWNPLIHIILVPAVSISWLYRGGLAGFVTLLPVAIFGVIFLQRVCILLTNSKILGFLAGLLLILNPYFAYFSTTAMTEVLFMSLLFASCYYAVLYLSERKIGQLIWTGVCITLTCLSRFEGLGLLPIVSLAFVISWFLDKRKFSEMKAMIVIFFMVSCVGLAFILIYNYMYIGNPFAFIRPATQLSEYRIVSNAPLPVWFVHCVKVFFAASGYMLGKYVVIVCLISAAFLPLFINWDRTLLQKAVALVILASPAAFVLASFITQARNVSVPPYGIFNNERYALTWVGFAILCPLILSSEIARRFKRSLILRITSIAIVVVFSFFSLHFSYQILAHDGWIYERSRKLFDPAFPAFIEEYDGGKVLMTKYTRDRTIFATGLPLQTFILESNYLFYDQSLKHPWLFARWVWTPHNLTTRYEKSLMLTSKTVTFLKLYEEVDEGLFHINEKEVQKYVIDSGYDPKKVPSLNPDIQIWNPITIFKDMEIQ